MIVKRYTWEDALIEAEKAGILSAGAVNMCLRLAHAINWEPTGDRAGMPSGLYWKNEEALRDVNSSRATYFRYRQSLFETGFLKEVNGNLIPQVPDLSQIETVESQVETIESHIETAESQIDTPYSEDTYTVDEYSDDSLSEEGPVVPTVPSNYEYLGSLKEEDFPSLSLEHERLDYFSNQESVVAVANAVEDTPESQSETEEELHDTPATEGVWVDMEQGEKYLEILLERNFITGPLRSKARRRFWDEDYEPTITKGVQRAGWVVARLTNPVMAGEAS